MHFAGIADNIRGTVTFFDVESYHDSVFSGVMGSGLMALFLLRQRKGEKKMFVGTIWSIVPPLFAIVLALLTKQVYLSLFAGAFLGAMFVSNFTVWGTFDAIFSTMADNIDLNILIFDVMLGMIIVLLGRSGGSNAYGKWASRRIKDRRGAMLATSALGVLIFVDDYFNCLTVGSIMRPVTDRHGVSRAKLAYLIDATAAPVCILAPVSSWAAAVSSYIPEGYDINGFAMFIQAIPYNFYAIFTLVMVFVTSIFLIDFGRMKKHERNAQNGDLFTEGTNDYAEADAAIESGSDKGKVIDLILPVLVLIVASVGAMIFTGYQSGAESFVDAFANCNASYSLVFGTAVTIIFMALLYLPRKVVDFNYFCNAIVDGFKIMVPAVTVLVLAWTLKGITGLLDVAGFVQGVFAGSSAVGIMPLLVFVVAVFLGFSTGTSWGTMGILIPIVVPMFYGVDYELMLICVSAIMAGAVCGDHISPISDTTIMSSTGAQCNHINHVRTQMEYAAVVIAVSALTYVFAGFVRSAWLSLLVGLALLAAALFAAKKYSDRHDAAEAAEAKA